EAFLRRVTQDQGDSTDRRSPVRTRPSADRVVFQPRDDPPARAESAPGTRSRHADGRATRHISAGPQTEPATATPAESGKARARALSFRSFYKGVAYRAGAQISGPGLEPPPAAR